MKIQSGIIFGMIFVLCLSIFPSALAAQASCYGSDYPDGLNTIPEAQTAAYDFNYYDGWSSTTFTRPSPGTIYNNMINDNLLFYAGHGVRGALQTNYQYNLLFANNPNHPPGQYSMGDLTYNQIHDILLAAFIACYSAADDPNWGNVIGTTYNKGVDCSLGFLVEIYEPQATYWDNNFIWALAQRNTVNSAIAYADNCVYLRYGPNNLGNTNHHAILGDGSIIIYPPRAGN